MLLRDLHEQFIVVIINVNANFSHKAIFQQKICDQISFEVQTIAKAKPLRIALLKFRENCEFDLG